MKSIKNIGNYPAGISIVSDDLVEFHAARIILLLRYCGKKDRAKQQYKIDGLTKLAKLDFFVRYPEFFRRAVQYLNKGDLIGEHKGGIESRMIRFHYGPWDERYYQVLPFLESRGLISIEKSGSQYTFHLTELGEDIATKLSADDDYVDLQSNITDVYKVLGNFIGSKLKELVYSLFNEEVAEKKFKDII